MRISPTAPTAHDTCTRLVRLVVVWVYFCQQLSVYAPVLSDNADRVALVRTLPATFNIGLNKLNYSWRVYNSPPTGRRSFRMRHNSMIACMIPDLGWSSLLACSKSLISLVQSTTRLQFLFKAFITPHGRVHIPAPAQVVPRHHPAIHARFRSWAERAFRVAAGVGHFNSRIAAARRGR